MADPLPPDSSPGLNLSKLLAEQMAAVVWSVDRDLRFTSSFGAGLAGLGAAPGQVVGMSLAEYFGSDTEAFKPMDAHRRALAGETVSFEVQWKGRWFTAHLEPIRAEGKEITGVLGIALDNTEQRRVQEELATSASLWRATLDATADGILAVDENGRLTSVNLQFLRMWSVPPSLVAAGEDRGLTDFLAGELKDSKAFLDRTREANAKPDADSLDILEFNDGRVFERRSRVRKTGEKYRGRVWSFRDITEQVSAENDLSEILSALRATLNATANGILVVNREGKIIHYNERFVEMWSLPAEVVASRDDARALAFVMDQIRNPEKFLRKVEELYQQPEAESFDWLEFKDGRVFERYSRPQRIGGRIAGRVWSFRDATVQRRGRERLHLQEAALDAVAEAVIMLDSSGRIAEWYASAERLFGYTAMQARGRGLDLLFSEKLEPATTRRASAAVGFPAARSIPARRRDGSTVHCENLLLRVPGEPGHSVSSVLICREAPAPEPAVVR